jgi:thiamine-phosphate pyrophosphorylase
MGLRQSLPRVWLVTDERQDGRVLDAVGKLPPSAGILFRHYRLPAQARRALFDQVLRRARDRDITVLLAGPRETALRWGADGWHGWEKGQGLRSASVHNLREVRRAEAGGACLLFVSPVFPTQSHPGGATLGPRRFAQLADQARRPVIALGGVTPKRAPKLLRLGAHGWAGVDWWTV